MTGKSNKFVKGDPRINRKGRPKLGMTIAEKVRDALNEPANETGNYTKLDELIDIAIAQASEGNFQWAEHLLARGYGKVPDKIEVTSKQEFDYSKLTDEEIDLLETLLKKMEDGQPT